MLVVHTGLLLYSGSVHSPTLNEPAHLVAGLSHWKFGRFDLYRVNPPLVRLVAALPVMAAGYKEDWSGFDESPGARPVFGMGERFVAANGARSYFLFMIARWACVPFSWCGAIVCYLWARDLYGRPAGLLACCLWCFSSEILAHASLVTADAHAAALGLAACYTFWRWLRRPTWLQAAFTGVVLGIAELAKTTLILFYVLWPVIWVMYRCTGRRSMRLQDWIREGAMLFLRLAIGLYVLNLGYALQGTLTPLERFPFVSSLFAGRSEASTAAGSPRIAAVGNRFAGTWLGRLPVPFPRDYILGIDIQQRDFEDYSRPSYLRGVWQEHGWWYYYLYAALIKLPIALWAMGALTLLTYSPRYPPGGLWRDELILLLPAILIVGVVSSHTGFNEHFRYVLPAFPFCFVLLGRLAGAAISTPLDSESGGGQLAGRFSRQLVPAAIPALMGWFLASSLAVYPHNLSYFNELVGGPAHGPQHLLGSSSDWGQGLRLLERELDSRPEWGPIAIAYHGPAAPESLGSRAFSIDWERAPSPLSGFSHVAISSNILAGAPAPSSWFSGPPGLIRDFQRFFRAQPPVLRIGGSLLVFEAEPYVRQARGETLTPTSSPRPSPPGAMQVGGLPTLATSQPEEIRSISGLLHVLLLHGLGPTGIEFVPSGAEALELLTDERRGSATFGISPFVRTRNGLRYRLLGVDLDDPLRTAGETHRDQCLGTFATLRLPLDYQLRLQSETCPLRELLSESVANFSYDQSEITWTAVAYAYYLPPVREWTDRFGRTTTFSDLLQHLMKTGYAGQSCAGLHVLQSIATIVDADCRHGILDPQTRIDGRKFLAAALADALRNQRADGSWDNSWHKASATLGDTLRPLELPSQIVVTGHMLELFHQMHWRRPPPRVLVHSTRWMLDTLTDPRFQKSQTSICPLTHALRSAQLSYDNRHVSYELAELFATD